MKGRSKRDQQNDREAAPIPTAPELEIGRIKRLSIRLAQRCVTKLSASLHLSLAFCKVKRQRLTLEMRDGVANKMQNQSVVRKIVMRLEVLNKQMAERHKVRKHVLVLVLPTFTHSNS